MIIAFIVGLVLCACGAICTYLYNAYGVYMWQYTLGYGLLAAGLGVLFGLAVVYCM